MQKYFLVALAIVLVVGLILGGCAREAPAPAPAPAPSWPKLTFVTTSSGTNPHTVAVAWTTLLRKYAPGVEITIEPAIGAPQAVKYFLEGKGDMVYNPGSLTKGFLPRTLKGKPLSEGPHHLLATLGAAIHVVTHADSDIHSIEDLRGKKLLAKVPAAPANDAERRAILAAYGMTDDDVVLLSGNNGKHLAQQLREGVGDAAFIMLGLRDPAIVELCTMKDIRWIPIPHDKMGFTKEQWSVPGIIPAGTYPKQDEDVSAVRLPSSFAVRKDMDPELAYILVKVFHEHIDELGQMAPWGKNFTIQNTVNGAFLPIHPGAIKYYKEQGAWNDKIEARQQELRELTMPVPSGPPGGPPGGGPPGGGPPG